ncbi:hypothetical protein DFH08DRAFT_798993 [Mycena albidolilacea]|uniref:Uncharacterized protein n=1 Tax=Mycena albidolilacea TaxID=1033008 RepID=A0AAD7F4L2_9AGAR|nr:hypothetical protein DFH08DRAFT_798993 [Mycena albidolilacea]
MFKAKIEDTSGNRRVEEVQGRVEAAKRRGGKLNTAGAPSELRFRERGVASEHRTRRASRSKIERNGELQVNKGAWKPKSGEKRKQVQPAHRVRVGHEEAYGHAAALGIHRAHEIGGNRGRKPEALGSANGCSQRIEPLGCYADKKGARAGASRGALESENQPSQCTARARGFRLREDIRQDVYDDAVVGFGQDTSPRISEGAQNRKGGSAQHALQGSKRGALLKKESLSSWDGIPFSTSETNLTCSIRTTRHCPACMIVTYTHESRHALSCNPSLPLVPGAPALMLHPERHMNFGVRSVKYTWTLASAPQIIVFFKICSMVVSPFFKFRWPIPQHASGSCVPVMVDIFSGLYRVLRIGLTENEANEWMEQEGENVQRFHLHRTSRKPKKSYQCGITRLALLNGNRIRGIRRVGLDATCGYHASRRFGK